MHRKILYFSVWPQARKQFAKKAKDYEKELDFQVLADVEFTSASDLQLYLDDDRNHGLLKNLYVIVDYLSFYLGKTYEKDAELVCKAIMGYPEVYFLFDESYVYDKRENSDLDFTTFLFPGRSMSDKLVKRYHYFNINDQNNPFRAISSQWTNLFDGTNLRYCVKERLYSGLRVEKRNFARVQTSRSENLALCVEEERTQNRFNSYALFANGFRVWPILSAHELKDFNEKFDQNEKKHSEMGDLKLIVRDYDIQFQDADPEDAQLRIDGKDDSENLIDYIRNAKYDKGEWKKLKEADNNHFWNNLINVQEIFISKGVDNVRIITNDDKLLKKKKGKIEGNLSQKTWEFVDGVSEQYLPGMYKPITGVYSSFHKFDLVKKRYDEGLGWAKKDKKGNDYHINTSRENHQHGVPLDIYDLAKRMIDRARRYIKFEKYVLSAMVAQEAIEVLNGFHESLMLKAYYVYAVSENAICMNLLGGNELWLEKDAYYRVRKIQIELDRMLSRKEENEDRENLRFNILNQIFSDCRQFCKKKEHFGAETIFISAMGHLNEGYDPVEVLKGFVKYRSKVLPLVAHEKKRAGKHFCNFLYTWILFLPGIVAAVGWLLSFFGVLSVNDLAWPVMKLGFWGVLLVFLILLIRPMNAVYGFMGTGGSVRIFFLNFILISFFFSCIYYFGFFRDAGISYDVNQPHISFGLFKDTIKPLKSVETLVPQIYQYSSAPNEKQDTVYKKEVTNYQPIGFSQVFQNTIMTSLMQEPTDFFAAVTTYNAAMESELKDLQTLLNNEKVELFYWILISQVLISWIFFGVFISLLYNKFRYES